MNKLFMLRCVSNLYKVGRGPHVLAQKEVVEGLIGIMVEQDMEGNVYMMRTTFSC